MTMGQLSSYLRNTQSGHAHWCPGCGELHAIPNRWQFNGDAMLPTFNPSVRITGKQHKVDAEGRWTGEWVTGPDGRALDMCCHYFLHGGVLKFCTDSTHALAGKEVLLPELPSFVRDDDL